MKSLSTSVFLGAAALTIIAAIATGLVVLGSPTDERARRIDDRRVAELQGIQAATDLFWTRHARVPTSLNELTSEPGVTVNPADPATGESYEYRAVDNVTFELCATFDAESGEIARNPRKDLWAHGPGRHCYRLDAEDLTDVTLIR